MKSNIHAAMARITIPLMIVMLACSVTPSLPSLSTPTGTDYRYDELPTKANESAAFEEYQAISKWSSATIAYYFINGTDQLDGDIEREIVSQAFALWSAQTPLTFSEATN